MAVARYDAFLCLCGLSNLCSLCSCPFCSVLGLEAVVDDAVLDGLDEVSDNAEIFW